MKLWMPLAVVAMLPFATVYCTQTTPPMVAVTNPDSGAGATIDASLPPTAPEPRVADSVVAASAQTATDSPFPTAAKATRKQCQAMEVKVGAAWSGACRTDADCDYHDINCGCPQPIAKAHIPAVDKAQHDYNYAGCGYLEPPRSCPTCAPSPPPKCKGGQCQ